MILWAFKMAIKAYGRLISSWFACTCRFVPTCSCYFLEALEVHRYGGLVLGIKRLLRCHPWGGQGLDMVPPRKKNDEGKHG